MLDREGLLSGTRPEITGGKIIMTGAPTLDGYEILGYRFEFLGLCPDCRTKTGSASDRCMPR